MVVLEWTQQPHSYHNYCNSQVVDGLYAQVLELRSGDGFMANIYDDAHPFLVSCREFEQRRDAERWATAFLNKY